MRNHRSPNELTSVSTESRLLMKRPIIAATPVMDHVVACSIAELIEILCRQTIYLKSRSGLSGLFSSDIYSSLSNTLHNHIVIYT